MRGRQSCTPARCTGLARGLRVGIAARFVDGSSARLEDMAKGTLWGDRENHSEDVDGDEGVGDEGDSGDVREVVAMRMGGM